MPAPLSVEDGEEDSSGSPLEPAINLLSQQIWCWGRDILRPEGNWLLTLGFERVEPPAERKHSSSVYMLSLPQDRCVVLRGFGVLFGAREHGGVFLPRYKFQPRYCPDAVWEVPPWDQSDLPKMRQPSRVQKSACVSLLLDLIEWIRTYEVDVIDRLGIGYRRSTLVDWNDGTRPYIPAEEVPAAWRELALKVAANSTVYLGGSSE
ncbi:MAG: hypothetical protein ACE361_05750 [Aureliella sp.]